VACEKQTLTHSFSGVTKYHHKDRQAGELCTKTNGLFRWKITTTQFKPHTQTVINTYTTQVSLRDTVSWQNIACQQITSTKSKVVFNNGCQADEGN